MVLLDTDHVSILGRGGIQGLRLFQRLDERPLGEVCVSIVSYEEQSRGWLSVMASAKTPQAQVAAYADLKRHLDFYRSMPIIDYTEQAAQKTQELLRLRLRVGTMDLRIAAIALVNNARLLSRNLRDFGKVPGLRVEDWTT